MSRLLSTLGPVLLAACASTGPVSSTPVDDDDPGETATAGGDTSPPSADDPADTGSGLPPTGPGGPVLVVDPPAVEFGSVPRDCPQQATITVTNRGTVDYTLRTALVTGARFPRYTLTVRDPMLPAGGSTQVDVRFETPEQGPHQAAAALYADVAAQPFEQVALRATANPQLTCPDADTDTGAP